MPTKTLITPMDGTPEQIVLADHATDFSPTAANDLRVSSDGSNELDVQLDLTSVADAAARQSAKWDFGAHWAECYLVRAAFELAATPTAGDLIELYFGWSHHATAGTGNPAALTGGDAAYTGYSSNLSDSVKQLFGPLLFTCTAQATGTVQVATVGVVYPRSRYGILVVKNESGAAFHSDAVESHVVLDPVVPEFQDA
jgi:hypothetical protein